MKTFTAHGGWGELICDCETGRVLEYDRSSEWKKDGDGYDDIVRLDVDEWRAFWPNGDLCAGHDILDFGSWDKSGRYTGPETDWRENLLADRPELAKDRTR